jgi:Cu(I)/Ag(I) efflux system membrane fusion protein
VQIDAGPKREVLVVPDSAVIDSGTRQTVLVALGEGRFEPREVKTGARGDNYVEVRDGLKEGEQVVVAANFLIDAESNLKAAFSGMGAAPASAASAPAAGAPSAGHRGQGTVDSIDAKAGTVSLNHEAIASLKWPAMTMEFKAANPSLLQGLKPGMAVSFEFVERQPGEWIVTSIAPAAQRAAR